MPNEVYSFITLRVSRDQSRIELSFRDRFADLTPPNDHVISAIKTIGTTPEPLDLGEVAAPTLGAFRLINFVESAWVELSLNADGSDPFCRLRGPSNVNNKGALAMALIPLTGVPIYAKADAAGRKIEYLICEAA